MVFTGLWVDTNGRFLGADGAVPLKVCPAGVVCGGSFLPIASGGKGMGAPPYAHGVKPYFGLYGIGQFDGQNSGHDFFGTVFLPSTGWINNCDGGRSHTYCDYSIMMFVLPTICGPLSGGKLKLCKNYIDQTHGLNPQSND